MTTPKREWIASPPYAPLATEYGELAFLACDGEHVNVEAREPITVSGGTFSGCMTVRTVNGTPSVVGRITYWGGPLTARREGLLKAAVFAALAEARETAAPAFRAAALRGLNNDIARAEGDVEEAERALAEKKAVLEKLELEEAELLLFS